LYYALLRGGLSIVRLSKTCTYAVPARILAEA
jgi:hypothetical protein